MWRMVILFAVAMLQYAAYPLVAPAQQLDTAQMRRYLEARDTAGLRRMIERELGPGATHGQLVEMLRQSGITRLEAHARLQALGYDPALIDPYFTMMERGGIPPQGLASADLVSAMRAMGVEVDESAPDTVVLGRVPAPDLPSVTGDEEEREEEGRDEPAEAAELKVFGRALFESRHSQFQPPLTGPVGPDYRLGPGDHVVLVMTGDVELAYQLEVSREGLLFIPDVGQVPVNGLTLAELEDRLYSHLGRVYSGVRRGSDATTRFHVTLGRLRTSQVYVIGDVERPNSYRVSSISTLLDALYLAGGPSESGSFRRVEVRRGGERIQVLDLYDYLLRGDGSGSIRLEQGDIVFVQPVGARVRIEGAVRRPAIYELKEGETLSDLIHFAGGLDASASVRRIQIDRIVPFTERRPGVERVLVDVDVAGLLSGHGPPVELHDGDVIRVFSVRGERRRRVTLEGEVRMPGVYEWTPGMTLWDVIERAQGLEETAYTPRAHVYRLDPEDGKRLLIRTPLLADSAGRALRDVVLEDRDSVVVYSRVRLRNPETVRIDGFVKEPGTYRLAEGMTLRDLILAAGGFVPGAYTLEAEVARRPEPLSRTSTTATILRIPLEGGQSKGHPSGDDGLPTWYPEEDEFTLRHGDQVFIRKAPGYEVPRTVTVTGEVMHPGTYVLATRQERLVTLLQRAGGLTPEAYAPGLQVYRGGRLLATDLPAALDAPEGRFDLVLQPGDSLHVPEYDPTVQVTGEVTFESRILFEPGKGLDYYISRAGGYTDLADEGRVTVTYQDGERATVERRFLFFKQRPALQPGSTIYVPRKPESERDGFDWGEFLSRTTAMASTLATLILAINQLNR